MLVRVGSRFEIIENDKGTIENVPLSQESNSSMRATLAPSMGDERVSAAAPESLAAIIALLRPYAAGNGQWRTMIEWD